MLSLVVSYPWLWAAACNPLGNRLPALWSLPLSEETQVTR